MKVSSLSILIPAYKDETTITSVVQRSVAVGRTYAKKFEIIIVNDASPDDLNRVLLSLKKTIPQIRIITHKKNAGFGGTIKELYFKGRYDWLYTTPGDYQFDPMEFTKLLPYIQSADMIIGRRKERHDVWKRRLQSLVYNGFFRILFGVKLHDINSVRLMKRTVVQKKLLTGSSAFIDAKLILQALDKGFRVLEVPIEHRTRKSGGASGGKLSVILPVIKEMFAYRFSL
jgi:glycosyltransferase involved in cell wall biosynthesis